MSSRIKVWVAVTFLIMVVVNALAEVLPINGVTTGQVAESYPNLFTPAAVTFAIWGLIYLLLAMHTLYQLGLFQAGGRRFEDRLLAKVGLLFGISSVANTLWIFVWHYDRIALSMLLMAVILICLILIIREIRQYRLSLKEKFLIGLPFSIYFGWITVATIANVTTLLVSLGWDGFGLSPIVWTIAVLGVGLLIGGATMLRNHDRVYGLAIIWAYAGILFKHVSANGFAGQYSPVIIAAIVCLALFLGAEIYLSLPGRQSNGWSSRY